MKGGQVEHPKTKLPSKNPALLGLNFSTSKCLWRIQELCYIYFNERLFCNQWLKVDIQKQIQKPCSLIYSYRGFDNKKTEYGSWTRLQRLRSSLNLSNNCERWRRNNLGSEWSGREELKKASSFPSCSVIRECSWKETQTEKNKNNFDNQNWHS